MIEAIFDGLADGICVSDAAGVLVYMNPAAERLLDVARAGAMGKTLCGILCGRLASGGASECASTCRLLQPGSSVGAVTVQGNYGPIEAATWKDFTVRRRSIWKNLRVRCLKSAASAVGEGGYLTIIEGRVSREQK